MASSKAIVYYSHNEGDPALLKLCRKQLLESAGDIPVIAVTHTAITDFERLYVTGKLPHCLLSIFLQIRIGVEATDAETIFLAEHDVLYPPGYFDVEPRTPYFMCYQTNFYSIDKEGYYPYKATTLLSQLVCKREYLLNALKEKIQAICAPKHFVGAEFRPPQSNIIGYANPLPSLDIRHSHNFSGMKKTAEYCQCIDHWGDYEAMAVKLGLKKPELKEFNNVNS